MKHHLSRYLSPTAKKLFLRCSGHERIKAQLELAHGANVEAVEEDLRHLGASEIRWHEQTHLLVIEIAIEDLPDIAELEDIGYVEVAERFGL